MDMVGIEELVEQFFIYKLDPNKKIMKSNVSPTWNMTHILMRLKLYGLFGVFKIIQLFWSFQKKQLLEQEK